MSNIAIQGAATGTGVFTLASPATNTDRTLTLPDEAGTVLTSAGVPSSAMPAGSVLQVVHGSASAQVSFSSGASGVVTGVAASITPSSESSKVLVLVSLDGVTIESDGSYGTFRLQRNGVNIQAFAYPLGWASVDNARGTTVSCIRLDAPVTTSALSYSVYWNNLYQSSTIQINRDSSGTSTITLMEIAA